MYVPWYTLVFIAVGPPCAFTLHSGGLQLSTVQVYRCTGAWKAGICCMHAPIELTFSLRQYCKDASPLIPSTVQWYAAVQYGTEYSRARSPAVQQYQSLKWSAPRNVSGGKGLVTPQLTGLCSFPQVAVDQNHPHSTYSARSGVFWLIMCSRESVGLRLHSYSTIWYMYAQYTSSAWTNNPGTIWWVCLYFVSPGFGSLVLSQQYWAPCMVSAGGDPTLTTNFWNIISVRVAPVAVDWFGLVVPERITLASPIHHQRVIYKSSWNKCNIPPSCFCTLIFQSFDTKIGRGVLHGVTHECIGGLFSSFFSRFLSAFSHILGDFNTSLIDP